MTVPEYTLNDGTTLPALGLGTYRLSGTDGTGSMAGALELGYRLLDSAVNYRNEDAVGEAVRRSPVPRDQVCVTSKLPGRDHAYARALTSVQQSLERTGLDQLDLYLIHWPNPGEGSYVEAWRALVESQRRGLLRTIGVSNFLPEHIARIADETGVVPAVNQIELHPYFPQPQQRAWHDEHGVVTQSWTPLGKGRALLDEPVVQEVAATHGRTAAQVVLRWHHQLGAVPIPKAQGAERQRENLAVFDFALTDEEMAAISGLGRPDGRTNDQDPAVYHEY